MKNQDTQTKQNQAPETETAPAGWKKPVRYLRELSVVVIGVAITFIGSNWISGCQERNKLDRHLQAVKIELEDNLAEVRRAEEYYQRLARLTRYLESDAPENLDPNRVDSLNFYGNNAVIGEFFTVPYKTSAFEMLKSSGLLSRIADENVSRSILDAYTSLDVTKLESDRYMEQKMTEIRNAIMDREEIFYGNILSPNFRRIYYFFAAYLNIEILFTLSARQLEETLGLLDSR